MFTNHCKANFQTLSHSGVNAHFQNSMAEKRICDLQDAARTMLVHAKHHWPKAINAHLWPYALRTANEIHANSPRADGKMPIELFSHGTTSTSPRHFHPFGCPIYILNDCMQAGIKGPKWEEHARVGVYLGNSPVHARNVALVLNTKTGLALASPQFHVQFDDLFETVKSAHVNIHWDKATGFTQDESKELQQGPPLPDTYFLPQTASDTEEILSRDTQVKGLSTRQESDLSQRKMGSTTDVQILMHDQVLRQSDIRSDDALSTNSEHTDTSSTVKHTIHSTHQPSSSQQSEMYNTAPTDVTTPEPTLM